MCETDLFWDAFPNLTRHLGDDTEHCPRKRPKADRGGVQGGLGRTNTGIWKKMDTKATYYV